MLGCAGRHSRLPDDVVLALLLNQTDTLKHVGDVVDTTLLDLQQQAGWQKNVAAAPTNDPQHMAAAGIASFPALVQQNSTLQKSMHDQ